MTLKGSPPRDPDREAEAQYLLIERIAASEKRHREILAELPEIVILLDEEGCIRFVNEAWERLLGTKPSGLEGRLIVDFIFLDDHRKWNKLIEAAAAASEVPTDREVRLFGVDEKLLWMNAKIRRLDSGEFLCALEDFTTRKRHQEELVKQQRLESIGRLAGGLAHDFNNFLTIILGNLNIAQVKLATGDGVRDELEIAAKACMQASGITKQMLTFSKEGAPITKIASVTELVRESVRLNLHGSKTRVIFDIDEALPPVEIDPDQMHQVFGNLMLNADQAMPEGGDLVIRLRRGSLPSVAGNTSGDDAAVIELIDQGEGIRACDLDYVADPYFTTKKDGTGLGLTSPPPPSTEGGESKNRRWRSPLPSSSWTWSTPCRRLRLSWR